MNNQKLLNQLAMIETDYDFYHCTIMQASTDVANAVKLETVKNNSKEIQKLLQQNIKLLVEISTPKMVRPS